MTRRSGAWMAALLLIAALSAGAWLARPAPSGAAAAAEPPRVSVTTVPARLGDFPVVLETTGTVTALSRVEVRPQVSAVVREVHIREGQSVKAGQLLFTLDSRADAAALAQARARLQQDRAALADAQRQLARSRELRAQGFVSQSAVDTNLAKAEALQAAVAADQAAIEAAQVALGHARIVAASAGRAGVISVFPGSLVQPSSAQPLVTLTQLDPVAVGFSLPQRNVADALAALRHGGASVEVRLPGDERALSGRLRFVDSAVDAGSGSVLAKALFDNADERLWPGAFVNVRFTLRTLHGVVVVPQAALIQGARSRSLYVVGDDGRAVLKTVEVLRTQGTEAVVAGIAPCARVVVQGKQNLRPGVLVAEAPAPPGAGASPVAP